ncbi:MAG: B12-binding domain-containing radical SAM protein [Candidatus Omnitrophica bacterium]|nr:B12-binding domain-containing radical SAM protein [Candidatus Omnitrophota bacterium]
MIAKKDMRILFVVRFTGDEYLGIMSLSAVLKQYGHEVELIEAFYKKVEKRLKENKPTIVVYSTVTLFVDFYLKLNKRLKKEFDFFSAFGGQHPTAVPELIQEEGVDGVCLGEGEFALLELVNALCAGKPIRNINNWWIKENGHIFKNPLRPLIENLDDLPFPDRDLFATQSLCNIEKMSIMTGRGCFYNCSYCWNSFYNQLYKQQGSTVRKRSVQNVIQEIEHGKKKFPLKFILFYDDIFILPYDWLEEFSVRYKQCISLPFFCDVRADLVNEQVVKLLRNAGCFSVSMGIETADDSLRSNLLGRTMSREQIVEAAKLIKGYGIKLKTTNLVDIPGSAIDIDFETIRLNIECQPDFATVRKLRIYPKTKIDTAFAESKNDIPAIMSSRNTAHTHVSQNMHSLFAIAVEFPFLLWFLKILIQLPLGSVYRMLYICWEGYCAYYRLYPTSIKTFLRGLKKYVKIITRRLVIP